VVSQPGDEGRGWPFRLLVGALGFALGPLATIVRDMDAGPGWSAIVDPARTPSPRWTAQLNGVTLTKGAPDAQQRSEIVNAAGLTRGGVPQLVAAVQQTLSPTTGTVTVVEHYLGRYGVLVVTYAAQTPDAALTERVAVSYTPAWLLPTVRVDAGWSVGQFETAYAAMTVANAETDFLTVNDLETELP
jgi:hypothetical protein